MKHQFKNIIKNGTCLLALALVFLLSSCKYEDFVPGTYPDALVYLPASVNGVYNVNTIAPTGVRYVVDLTAKKLNIPLGAARSGLTRNGEVTVNLTPNADTINKLIANTKLTGTDLLPSANYTLPTSATIESSKDAVSFNLSLDLDYLRNNATKKFAVAVSIANSSALTVNPTIGTAVIVIDAKILKPAANFTSKVETKKVTFTNISTYGLTYSWDFGNGSTPSTDASPIYNYPAAGTYTVKLTTTGITGSLDANVKTATLTVL